jgi:acetyl-CoA carboxylase biotin carboxyl carrier protein
MSVKEGCVEVHEIQALIEMFERSTLSELTLERGNERLILKRDPATHGSTKRDLTSATMTVATAPLGDLPSRVHARATSDVAGKSPTAPAGATVPPAHAPEEWNGYVIKSPIVGTFYRRPGPNEDPFVVEGDRVEKGDTVCIIEAMKVMNEIQSEQSGIVEKVLAEDGKPVEYGQALIVLRPA